MLGKTLDGKYRIERLLGSGGMGSVYAARDRSGRVVAVKVIHARLADAGSVLARFEHEARAASSIDTEHIARCLDAGTDPETESPYMVLEHLVGDDLSQVIRRTGPLRPETALAIAAEACVGLGRAHEAGIIHRDIKPANLFLARREDGRRVVKILDFGIAKIKSDPCRIGEDTSSLTRTGALLGSPLYMSPEQAKSGKDVDARSDLWSLGVVLYQALSGRTPNDHAIGLGELLLALCGGEPPPIQHFSPWVAPEIAAVIDLCLRLDPADRCQTAGELFSAIRAIIPGGIDLDDASLAPLDARARAVVAPMYIRGIGVGAISSAREVSSSAALPSASLAGTLPIDTPSPRVAESTEAAVSTTRSSRAPADHGGSGGALRAPLLVVLAIGGITSIGVGVYALAGAGPPPVTHAVDASAAIALPDAIAAGSAHEAADAAAPAPSASTSSAPRSPASMSPAPTAKAPTAAPTEGAAPETSASAAAHPDAGRRAPITSHAPSKSKAITPSPLPAPKEIRLDHSAFGDRQ